MAAPADPGHAQHVLLVEGSARVGLDAIAPRIADALAPNCVANHHMECKSFDLTFAIERAGLRHASARRQPQRPDLRARWS
ncbi:MAG: hypothetical protein ABI537_04775 [Casimicrobiaceae bacterium]